MVDMERLRVPPSQLRLRIDPSRFRFGRTDEVAPLEEFIGQDRAIQALEFGLSVDRPGYNIFVSGLTGTGRTSAIQAYVQRAIERQREAGRTRIPDDWCYVYNFREPDRPRALRLPAGEGRRLHQVMEDLLEAVRTAVRRAFTSEDYEHRRRELMEGGQQEAQRLMEAAQQEAQRAGFMLRFSPLGVAVIPVLAGRPLGPEEMAALDPLVRKQIEERQRQIMEMVNEVGDRLRALERDIQARLRELDRQVGEAAVSGLFRAVVDQFRHLPQVASFLEELREYTLAHLDLFRDTEMPQPMPRLPGRESPLDPFLAFRCNLFVDNSQAQGPPVIIEHNPTWSNLFGRIERRAFMGAYFSDHTQLRAGSVHRANGGYLILDLNTLALRPGSWDGLKRVIRTREVRLEDPLESFGWLMPQGLQPEPIPVDLKVIITGDPLLYFYLSTYDPDFWELFKVKADFDYQISLTPETLEAYARFISGCCRRDQLRPFDAGAVAKVIEHASRMVDDQEKLTARFGLLRDVLVEADYWAGQEGAPVVQASHVQKALRARYYRLNLVEERVRELIAKGVIMVDVDGAVVGQVNGLAVLDFGDHRFGRPSRITARTFLGQRGVVSIDRESQLSGRIHDKGVFTISGYLGWKYAQDKPLSLSATISFEQAYEPVEGDSASLAELCAIISAIAQVPLRQDLAVTGSVNQKGEVQPVGGVNEKVEGFFEVCRAMGLSGRQGVIIPARNVRHLNLREEVVEAVERGEFHVYAVNTVDEALELLTGMPAGERGPDGTYPEGTLNALVDKRLQEMGEALRRAGRPKEPREKEEEGQEKEPPGEEA
jgi:lon-related putative ATP-dependent protease